MTASEQRAISEIKQLKDFDKKLKDIPSLAYIKQDSKRKQTPLNDKQAYAFQITKFVILIREINTATAHLRDKDGNNIDDFFKINAKDNYGEKQPSKHSLHLMIVDTIKAVRGDTKTLLRE